MHELPDLLHRSGKQEGMIHHDFQILAIGKLDQFLRLRGAIGERFFDKNVFPILESCFCQLVVRPYRRHHRHCIDSGRCQNLICVRRKRNGRMGLAQPVPEIRILITHQGHFRIVVSLKIPNDVRPPVAVSNYPDPNHGSPIALPRSLDCGILRALSRCGFPTHTEFHFFRESRPTRSCGNILEVHHSDGSAKSNVRHRR